VASTEPTLQDVFLPSVNGQERLSPEQVKQLEAGLRKEFDGVTWTASMPDVVSKISELLDIPVSDVFVESWKKALAIQKALDDSKAAPRDVLYVDLAEHTISSTHHPYISVHIARLPPKNIKLTVVVSFVLTGFTLTIQRGEIQKIRTGSCEVEGKLECLGVKIKKNPVRFNLPGAISIRGDAASEAH
jgi:hypothetical protein